MLSIVSSKRNQHVEEEDHFPRPMTLGSQVVLDVVIFEKKHFTNRNHGRKAPAIRCTGLVQHDLRRGTD
jgi:hypothetical protein